MSTRSMLRPWTMPGVLAAVLLMGACGGYKSPSSSTPGSTPTSTTASISQLVPASVAAGSMAFTLTVNGSGFGTDAVVYWNGSPRSTTHVSAGQLTAGISAADVATKGTVSVTVVGGGYTSNAVNFTIS